MAGFKQAGFQTAREHLHNLLKNPGRASPADQVFFNRLRTYRLSTPLPTPLDFIEKHLSSIDELDKRYGDLLRRRYWKNETIRQVASSFHLSTDQVYHLLRDALNLLTKIILEKEDAFRKSETQGLIADLPAPDYSKLFGVEKVMAKLTSLLASQDGPWIVAVSGIGGIGKTALVDSVIRENLVNFEYREVVWIRTPKVGDLPVGERLTLILARRLLNNQFATSSQDKALSMELRKKPYLIVVDGLEASLDDHLLSQLQEFSNPTRILLTCRNFPVTSFDVHHMNISEIDLESAKELLDHQAQVTGLKEKLQPFAKSIYHVVGGNPLALKLAVGLLKTWSVETALRALRDGKGRHMETFFDSIYAVAWDSLDQVTRQVFGAMVFIGNEGATLDHLRALTTHGDEELREAIAELVQRSLVEARGSMQERRYGIHSLTETFLLRRSEEMSFDTSGMTLTNIEYWETKMENEGHSTVMEENGNNLYRAAELGLEFGQIEPLVDLLFRLYSTILTKRISSIWLGLFVKAIRAEKNTKRNTKLLNQLGGIYWQMHLYDQALETFRLARNQAQRENSAGETISAQLGIALVYWTLRSYKKANREVKLARKMTRAGFDDRVQSRLSAVSGIIAQAQGKYAAAENHFLKAARHYKKDSLILAQIATNRGLCFQTQKHFSQALKQYRKAEDLLGNLEGKGTEIAQIEMLRSSAYYQIGDLANSEAALMRAAAMIADQETDANAQAFFESSLGRVYLSLGKKKEAKETLLSSARLWKKAGNPRIELNVTEFFWAKFEN